MQKVKFLFYYIGQKQTILKVPINILSVLSSNILKQRLSLKRGFVGHNRGFGRFVGLDGFSGFSRYGRFDGLFRFLLFGFVSTHSST